MSTPSAYSHIRVCEHCSATISSLAEVCPKCGVRQLGVRMQSDKRIMPAAILAFLFGVFGVHRFYVGKIGTGVLQLFTLGGLGIWALADFVLIVLGQFRDADGNKITEWT